MNRAPYYPDPNVDCELAFTMGTPVAPLFAAMCEHAQKHGVTPFPMNGRPFCFITSSGEHRTFATAGFEELNSKMTRVTVHMSALSEEEDVEVVSAGTQEALNAWKRELTLVAHHIDARPELRRKAELRYLSALRSAVDTAQFPFHVTTENLAKVCRGMAINADATSLKLAFLELARMEGVQIVASHRGNDPICWVARSGDDITIGTALLTQEGRHTSVVIQHELYTFDTSGGGGTPSPSRASTPSWSREPGPAPWSGFMAKLTSHAKLMQSPYLGQ